MPLQRIKLKSLNAFRRLWWFIINWPKRLLRLCTHIFSFPKVALGNGLPVHYYEFYKWRFLIWLVEIVFYLMDLFAIPEIYETCDEWLKWKSRAINRHEQNIIQEIFGKKINLKLIIIDDTAGAFTRKYNIAYVTFNTINCWKSIPDELLVHEVTHCWQYQRFGSVYLLRALLGQKTQTGYSLKSAAQFAHLPKDEILNKFNYEQQAEIFCEYFKHRYNIASNTQVVQDIIAQFKDDLLA